MKIIAYAYEAGYHCVSCAQKRFGILDANAAPDIDENGLRTDQEDSEGNQVSPVFSTDEQIAEEAKVCEECLTPVP